MMRLFFAALSGILVFASIGHASDSGNVIPLRVKGQASEDLTYRVAWDPRQTSVTEVLSPALGLVHAVAPAGFTLAVGGGSTPDFIIEVTDSKKARIDIETHRAQGVILSSTADAYTIVLAEHPRGPFIVRLLWDRLTTVDVQGQAVERSDAFIRVVAALVHEIYGNVRSFNAKANLLLDPSHRYSDKYQKFDQAFFELRAFQAGIEALQRLSDLGKRIGLPEKMLGDIRSATLRETAALAGWQEYESKLRAEQSAVVEAGHIKSVIPLGTVPDLSGKRCEMLFRSTK